MDPPAEVPVPAIEVTVPCGTWFHPDPEQRTWAALWAATPEADRPGLLAWAAARGVVAAGAGDPPPMRAEPGSACERRPDDGRYLADAARAAGDGPGRPDVPEGPGGGSARLAPVLWPGWPAWLAVLAVLLLVVARMARRR
jgi:hypothetical protein